MWPFSKKKPAAPALPTPPKSSVSGPEPRGGPFLLECGADLGQGPLPVFPLLMPASYTPAPTGLARPLIVGPKLPNIPQVTLCYLIPVPGSPAPNRGFIKQERVAQLGKKPADFEREALHNVATRPATWQTIAVQGRRRARALAVAVRGDQGLAQQHPRSELASSHAHHRRRSPCSAAIEFRAEDGHALHSH